MDWRTYSGRVVGGFLAASLAAESPISVVQKTLAVVALALTVASHCDAQGPARIAWVWPGGVANSVDFVSAFRQGMSENGLIEGTHYVIEQRYGEGHYDRFRALTEELRAHDPAVIMVVTIASVQAAQQVTKTVPIVFVNTNDPVGARLVASLNRPGGNTTGFSNQNEDLVGKYLDLLREMLPRASRLAVLGNPANSSNPKMFVQANALATNVGLADQAFEATSPESLDVAFGAIAQHRPDALVVLPDAVFNDQRDRLAAFALQNRIPLFTFNSEMVESGALISYGAQRRDLYRRAAGYVKKILAGAKPGELPVQQPIEFELALNLKTAKALGLTIPQPLRLRADVVIE